MPLSTADGKEQAMSVSLYRWTEACDGQPCVGDCDKCGDLISRQDAIEALRRAEALTRAFGYHNVIETIRELPSAHCTDCPLKGVVTKLP